MKRFAIGFLLIVLYACQENINSDKQVKEPIAQLDTSFKLIQTASGTIQLYKEIIIRNSRFQIVVIGNDTTFISTKDSNFVTPEGYRIGCRFGDLSRQLKDNIKKEPGFTYWIDLHSSWKLGFCIGSTCTDYTPLDSSTVDFIFKTISPR
jgi:hypothetical protein